MTLKGQKNHFNVKFLKGYGHSISVKNSKIILKDNHNPFSEPTTEEWFVKNMPYEKIILQGKGYISTEALSLLSQNNRNAILVDNHGKPVTFMNGMMDSLTATKYRMAQYDTFRNPEKCEYLRRQIISAKKESQLRLVKQAGRLRTSILSDSIEKIGKFSTITRLVNLNADKKRMWFEDLKNVNDRKMIDSMPISLNFVV